MIFPEKLKKGDLVRIVAPARSIGIISEENRTIADRRLREVGLRLSFGEHVEEMDDFDSSSIESRVADLHAAFADPEVRMILPVIGGFNSNQLLRYLDWDLIRNNPKILCGYSDITALNDAIYTKTGIVSYSGPTYAAFAEEQYFDYTLSSFRKCLFSDEPFEVRPSETWSDDGWYKDQVNRNPIKNGGYITINEGSAKGKLIGGNLCTFNLLQGTEYMPDLEGSVLFIEDDDTSKLVEFDRNLQSLIHLSGFKGVRGIVLGRFQTASEATNDLIIQMVKTKRELDDIPVIANVDFGHTQPMTTYPIGGAVKILAGDGVSRIEIIKH